MPFEIRNQIENQLKKIKVKYKKLKPILDFEKAENSKIIIHNDDGAFPKIPVYFDATKNMPAKVEADIGNFDDAFENNKIKRNWKLRENWILKRNTYCLN